MFKSQSIPRTFLALRGICPTTLDLHGCYRCIQKVSGIFRYTGVCTQTYTNVIYTHATVPAKTACSRSTARIIRRQAPLSLWYFSYLFFGSFAMWPLHAQSRGNWWWSWLVRVQRRAEVARVLWTCYDRFQCCDAQKFEAATCCNILGISQLVSCHQWMPSFWVMEAKCSPDCTGLGSASCFAVRSTEALCKIEVRCAKNRGKDPPVWDTKKSKT